LVATGIFTVGYLTVKELYREARAFWKIVHRCCVEGWLTEPFDNGFWSHAISHLFARHPLAFGGEKASSSDAYAEQLAADLRPIVGLDNTFLSTVVTLHLNGVASETISDGVRRDGVDLRALIYDAIHLDDLSPSGSRLGTALRKALADLYKPT
jgi:hypothetical protein